MQSLAERYSVVGEKAIAMVESGTQVFRSSPTTEGWSENGARQLHVCTCEATPFAAWVGKGRERTHKVSAIHGNGDQKGIR